MLFRALTSHHFCFSEASKPFWVWACSIRQQHVFRNAEVAPETNLDDENPGPKKISRNCYEPHPDVLERSEEEIERFRNDNEIKIKGRKPCPRPIFKLEEANFPSYIMDKFRAQNFIEPTPIQSQSWPIALQGDNMVGIARTGSGKTLAYLVPSIIRMKEEKQNKRKGPLSLVLAPTRELALQIKSVSDIFRDSIRSVAVYGGASRLNQESLLGGRPDIVIATPGRLLDFLRSQVIKLSECSYIVMDEADRMLDMGFEPQIREIMEQTESDKQVLMWSATWPKEIRSLAEDFLEDYIHLTVGSEELTANPNIQQIIKFCTHYDKVNCLMEFLKSTEGQKCLIFTETKRMADNLKNILYRKGFRTDALHGDKSQAAREQILRNFRDGRSQLLIATEVAARGLDVTDIEYVINYELPKTIDSYIHRIGRTARHEKKGTAFSLMTEEDKPLAKDLVDVLLKSKQEVPDQLLELAKNSVRINFRERYAPRDGNANSWKKKPFRRYDDNSYGSRRRNNYDDFNSFGSRRRNNDGDFDSFGDEGNSFQSRRKNYNSDDTFEFGGGRQQRRSNYSSNSDRSFNFDERSSRRSRDDDMW